MIRRKGLGHPLEYANVIRKNKVWNRRSCTVIRGFAGAAPRAKFGPWPAAPALFG